MVITNGKLISIDADDIINGEFDNDTVIEVGDDVFYELPTLIAVVLHNAIRIGERNFRFCKNLRILSLPNVTDIDCSCIHYCEKLWDINISDVINIKSNCIWGCPKLRYVLLSQVLNIGEHCFYDCMTLTRLILPFETISLTEGMYYPFVIKQERLTKEFLILRGGNLLSYHEGVLLNNNRPYMVIQDGKRGYGNTIKQALNNIINGQIQFHPKL
jgi:hypothetical protein